ncbi:TPR-like protein [Macrolepiota fuliginosa MF-IS2]|uniref:TPR-like protein n=1 Tax=Macrolepiota fuliginosa MF-IS2 TaxID=1400762 RepID=A0A9P5XEX8_9AGAR|nr:TPR-like protein [Macrolepiota fuliginosa MF-IS2]
MSHSHTHAPGEEHSHSHSHAPQQQQPIMPTPDPTVQALIDQDFRPVPLALAADGAIALCEPHKLEKCDNCNVDFVNTNRLSRLLVANPNLLCPPPSNVVSQKLTQMVTSAKDEGNALFKVGQAQQAILRYTTAATLAIQRPPWEANQFMREELSATVSNRSAAYFEAHDYVSALADAETVIAIRRNWPKGHYRKAKALLGMDKPKEAADAVKLGLSYEPNNNELVSFLADIEKSVAVAA